MALSLRHDARVILAPVALAVLAAACAADAPSVSAPSAPTDIRGARAPRIAASVIVTPSSATVAVGGSVQLDAAVRDARGRAVSTTIVWASSAPAVAAVSSTGLVRAVAAGSATITATESQGGLTGTSSILVVTQPVADTAVAAPTAPTAPAPSTSTSCATPGAGWIFCDDFEQDRIASYFEYNGMGGGFARTSGVGRAGSTGMRARFAAGQVEAGNLKLAFGRTPSAYIRPVDGGTTNHRNIYWRLWVRTQDGWQGGAGQKLMRAQILAGSSWQQAMVAPVWGGNRGTWQQYHLNVDPVSGTDEAGNLKTTGYGDDANLRWLGAAASATPLFDAAHVGKWYCVEANARLNDAGLANGSFTLWVDGVKEAERTGLNWVGSYSAYGINTVFVENHWNEGSPVAQERYFDEFVVSTQRIGC